MSGFRMITLRSLTGPGPQTREWMARARTPETRAEIRRWSRWETTSACLLLVGAACGVATPLSGLGLAAWHVVHGDAPWLWWLLGSLAITALFLMAGSWLGSYSSDRRLTVLYADGHVSIGRLDKVITQPGGGDEQTSYDFAISAELSDGVVLHRELHWGEDSSLLYPERWVRRTIRFRHNTLDPNNLGDVLFDGWVSADNGGARDR